MAPCLYLPLTGSDCSSLTWSVACQWLVLAGCSLHEGGFPTVLLYGSFSRICLWLSQLALFISISSMSVTVYGETDRQTDGDCPYFLVLIMNDLHTLLKRLICFFQFSYVRLEEHPGSDIVVTMLCQILALVFSPSLQGHIKLHIARCLEFNISINFRFKISILCLILCILKQVDTANLLGVFTKQQPVSDMVAMQKFLCISSLLDEILVIWCCASITHSSLLVNIKSLKGQTWLIYLEISLSFL